MINYYNDTLCDFHVFEMQIPVEPNAWTQDLAVMFVIRWNSSNFPVRFFFKEKKLTNEVLQARYFDTVEINMIWIFIFLRFINVISIMDL